MYENRLNQVSKESNVPHKHTHCSSWNTCIQTPMNSCRRRRSTSSFGPYELVFFISLSDGCCSIYCWRTTENNQPKGQTKKLQMLSANKHQTTFYIMATGKSAYVAENKLWHKNKERWMYVSCNQVWSRLCFPCTERVPSDTDRTSSMQWLQSWFSCKRVTETCQG